MAINTRNVRLITGLMFLCLIIAASVTYNPILTLTSVYAAGIGVWLIVKKKLRIVVLSIPFLLFSFLPSDFVYKFRLLTPAGYISATVILICCLSMFIPFMKMDKQLIKRCFPILIILSLFVCVNLTSLYANGYYTTGNIKDILKTATLSFLLFLLTMTLSSKLNSLLIFKFVATISSIVSILGILEFMFGFQPYYESYASNDFISFTYNNVAIYGYLRRVVSTIGNPLVLSTYLLLSLPFIFYLKEKIKKQKLLNIAMMVHVLSILLTLSRTSIIILFIVYYLYLFRSHKVGKVIKGTLLLGVASATFYFGLKYFLVDTLFWERMTFNLSSNSVTHRTDSYGVLMTILDQNPFFGLGLHGTQEFLLYSSGLQIATLDNVYLEILAQTGLIGISIYFLLLLAIYTAIKKMDCQYRFYGKILLLVIVGSGFTFNIMYFEAVWGVFWFLLALFLSREIRKA